MGHQKSFGREEMSKMFDCYGNGFCLTSLERDDKTFVDRATVLQSDLVQCRTIELQSPLLDTDEAEVPRTAGPRMSTETDSKSHRRVSIMLPIFTGKKHVGSLLQKGSVSVSTSHFITHKNSML